MGAQGCADLQRALEDVDPLLTHGGIRIGQRVLPMKTAVNRGDFEPQVGSLLPDGFELAVAGFEAQLALAFDVDLDAVASGFRREAQPLF